MMEISLGSGEVSIQLFTDNGRLGLKLQKMDVPFMVGEEIGPCAESHEIPGEHVIIWLGNEPSARVLQDSVNMAVLHLIEDK